MSFGVIYDTDFNQNNPKLISSDVSGTFFSTFPTTSTGDSQGNYNRLGIDAQNNNRWDFLNVSGLLNGGFNFWNSSNTQAPLLLSSLDDTGLTIDRSTTVYNPSYKTFGVSGSGFDYVFLSTLPEFPPTNWEVYNMYVVRVGNNTATLSTGVDYNVDYRNTEVITFHTTSDRNSPIIDSTGVTSILIPYGGTPVVSTKTSILTSEALFIKNDPSFNSINLSNNGLSVSDATSNNTNLSSSSLILNSYYNSDIPLNIINISGTTIQINDNDQGLSSNISASEAQFIDGDKTGIISAPYTYHNNSTTNTTSILSSNDLTFNNVSLKSQVATNTTDISNININLSSLNNLKITQISPYNQNASQAIYADGRPMTSPSAIFTQQYAFSPSWYFKNTVAGYKINWYLGPDLNMTVSQVLGFYMNILNGLMTSNDNFPFITIYTQPQSGDPNFYHSKRTYLFNQSITPTTFTRYFMYYNLSGTCPTPQHYGSTLNNMQLSTVSGSNFGPFNPSELILAFCIGSNSASSINSVEFAVNKFGIMTATGTTELNLMFL